MFIGPERNLDTNSVRRSGGQLDILLLKVPSAPPNGVRIGWDSESINISPLTG